MQFRYIENIAMPSDDVKLEYIENIKVAQFWYVSERQMLEMKLPRLIDHPDQAGGIVCWQSAMKQLQKRKELHHEKTKHLFQPKSRTSWAFRTSW